jgi:DNA modification methylase
LPPVSASAYGQSTVGLRSAIETQVIYCDENLGRLSILPDESVDLVYLDPPFFSNRIYEVIWGDEAEVRSFEDRWRGGIGYYVDWMRQRMVEVHRVLAPEGSLYLHCDPNASHYLKVMLDGVFGESRFRNEITWQRTNTHSDAKRWSPVSDTILYYGKGDRPTWNAQYLPHDDTYVDDKYRFQDPDGRRYRLDNMTSPNPRPNMTYAWKGHEPPPFGWRYSRETMARLDREGRIWYPDSKSKRPQLKRYLDEMNGVVIGNVWTDIAPINSRARERTGYPTQKPESLLERIILASSDRGDVVLDPFCGCGTALVVAERLKRKWIGIDISPTAVRIIRQRLWRAGADARVEGLPETEEDLRRLKPFEFQNWVIDSVNGRHARRRVADMGIDGYSFLENLPIQVKQSDKVGREVIDGFETAVRRDGKHKGYVIAFSFTKGAYDEAARAKREGLEIALVDVATLLENPSDRPPQPDLEEMVRQLFEGAREAAREAAKRGGSWSQPRANDARPTVAELVASDTTGS